MEYEKAYKEALEKAKMHYAKAKEEEDFFAVAIYENIFPELRESEDEVVRRSLIDLVNYHFSGEERDAALSYLEKQKFNTEGDFGRGYDCGYQAGYAVAMNEMKPKVATAILDSEKQKEQKPAEINVKALLKADRLASAEMTGRLKERSEILENPEKYGLLRPADWCAERCD